MAKSKQFLKQFMLQKPRLTNAQQILMLYNDTPRLSSSCIKTALSARVASHIKLLNILLGSGFICRLVIKVPQYNPATNVACA